MHLLLLHVLCTVFSVLTNVVKSSKPIQILSHDFEDHLGSLELTMKVMLTGSLYTSHSSKPKIRKSKIAIFSNIFPTKVIVSKEDHRNVHPVPPWSSAPRFVQQIVVTKCHHRYRGTKWNN